MKWVWILLVGLLACPVAAEWVPVKTEIAFEAGLSEMVEAGSYEIFVENTEDVMLMVSVGINFESIPTELDVREVEDSGIIGAEFDVETEYVGDEGSQYFAYFNLTPGESRAVEVNYVRPNYPVEDFWAREYTYNSPIKLIFNAGDSEIYYEEASYTGTLAVDDIGAVTCRRCLQEGSSISVKGSMDFSVQWSVQKFPIRQEIVYSAFIGFLFAFVIVEVYKWLLGGHRDAAPG